MTVSQFSQSQSLRGSTLLLLRQHGLYVSQRNRRGVAWLETEIPYEELLPIGLEYAGPPPAALPRPLFWVLGWLLIQLIRAALPNRPAAPDLPVALLVGGTLLVAVLVAYWWRLRSRTVTLNTNRIRLTLPDRPGQRPALEAFTDELRRRAHGYLREEYAQVNPLGPIELQLHRLHWLHRLQVLSPQELQALSTRLTGRLSLDPLKLMGQDLETPYVN
ncbi:hypothetical protein [Hymenobacter weizhouensis]|uniref:hypothetical protein n=1 Tax=Hymenobacter sp. YIM 151500-1 TaxID=2987689 RepID=UPI0022277619|nr:hypothetical protein [Hymenobacter sp. YIM 151500-1]UYZ64748.1 hypothetical protein OIS53_07835 [Hymenobacter sp. YIM 151500-1]